jgi:hypothetical protein
MTHCDFIRYSEASFGSVAGQIYQSHYYRQRTKRSRNVSELPRPDSVHGFDASDWRSENNSHDSMETNLNSQNSN